jgi:outer membrane lipase/esterase
MYRAILAAAATVLMAVPSFANTYTSYYAFGDSLTDDGKGLTLGAPPPFADGRFSSGPVWAEYIADVFDAAGLENKNFALGGATAGDANTNNYPQPLAPLGTFNGQIDVFDAPGGGDAPGLNPLISVLLGPNDIFQAGNPFTAAAAVVAGIQRLAQLNSIFDDFLVSNLPNLALTPDGSDDPQSSGLATTFFNSSLATGLAGLETTLGINIINLDQFTFFNDVIADPQSLGLTNVTDACIQAPDPEESFAGFNCTIVGFDGEGAPIYDLALGEQYLFVDGVHPNGTVQAAFGQFAIDALGEDLPQAIAVPLPMGALLLLSGLGVFGAVGRKRSVAA